MSIDTTTIDTRAKGHNSDGSKLNVYMSGAREAVKAVGNTGVQFETAKGALIGFIVLAYQNDDYMRGCMNAWLHTRNVKLTSKEARDRSNDWFAREFEVHKPGKGAIGKDVTRYALRVSSLKTSITRAKEYTTRGLVFSVSGDNKHIYVTKESYNAVIKPDTLAGGDIEVATMNKDGTKTTWSALAPTKKKAEPKAGTVVTVSAANFAMICNAAKTASEAVTADKMTGTDKVAALNAFFALQALLNAKEDKAMVKLYEDLTNDPARKAA